MSATAREAQALIESRERVGLAKYGTTCDRRDLTPAQWAQHAIEEQLDAAMYLLAFKRELPLMIRAAFDEGRRVAHSSDCPTLAFERLSAKLLGGNHETAD